MHASCSAGWNTSRCMHARVHTCMYTWCGSPFDNQLYMHACKRAYMHVHLVWVPIRQPAVAAAVSVAAGCQRVQAQLLEGAVDTERILIECGRPWRRAAAAVAVGVLLVRILRLLCQRFPQRRRLLRRHHYKDGQFREMRLASAQNACMRMHACPEGHALD